MIIAAPTGSVLNASVPVLINVKLTVKNEKWSFEGPGLEVMLSIDTLNDVPSFENVWIELTSCDTDWAGEAGDAVEVDEAGDDVLDGACDEHPAITIKTMIKNPNTIISRRIISLFELGWLLSLFFWL